MRRTAIALTALVLLAAACGDDDGGATDTGEGTTPPSAPAEATETTEAPATTAAAAPAPSGDVEDALDAYETATFRATYRFGAGDDEQTLVISRDPSQDPPVTATLIGADGEEGRFLTIGDRSLICGPPGEECLEFPGGLGFDMGQALLGPMLSGLLLNEELTTPGFAVEEGTAEIAGRTGLCFTFTPQALVIEADVDFIRQCVDRELGFILLFEGLENDGTSVQNLMELVQFGMPQPGDFEPSGPVTTMPGG